jgi:hypothetical protein
MARLPNRAYCPQRSRSRPVSHNRLVMRRRCDRPSPDSEEDSSMDNAMEPSAERKGRILVTGGTGTLGRLVVPRLRDAGCKVRVQSRRSREARGAEDGSAVLSDEGAPAGALLSGDPRLGGVGVRSFRGRATGVSASCWERGEGRLAPPLSHCIGWNRLLRIDHHRAGVGSRLQPGGRDGLRVTEA